MNEELVCYACVGEEYLKKVISDVGTENTCSYCDDLNSCVPLYEVADLVHIGIQQHFIVTSTEPSGYEYALSRDKEMNYEWEREGQEVNYLIQDIVKVDEGMARAYTLILDQSRIYSLMLAQNLSMTLVFGRVPY